MIKRVVFVLPINWYCIGIHLSLLLRFSRILFDGMRLSDLKDTESGIITKVLGRGALEGELLKWDLSEGKK